MKRFEYTPELLENLEENEIFIFGSNLAGIHGAGAAKLAFDKFGAEWGVGVGLTGKCYAFPTKRRNVIERLTLEELRFYVVSLEKTISENKDKTFYLTKVGCGLAGYSINDIAPLFKDVIRFENVIFPKEFIATNAVSLF